MIKMILNGVEFQSNNPDELVSLFKSINNSKPKKAKVNAPWTVDELTTLLLVADKKKSVIQRALLGRSMSSINNVLWKFKNNNLTPKMATALAKSKESKSIQL